MRRLLIITVAIVLLGGGALAFWDRSRGAGTMFRTAPVTRGDLLVTISATGTVEPEEVVDVGAQIVGKIKEFGKDRNGKMIDYGSVVEEGTILAQIDDELYQSDVEQTFAQLEQARSNVMRAKADLEQMKAKLFQADQNWKRAQELGPSRSLSATDYDSYRANYETAKAAVAVGDATIVQSEKAVAQAEASWKRSQTNLGYCTIRSPVKGTIIDRRVNIGQTVVSSLNAPSLFLIAKDLKRLQVWASVNEADIGRISAGQPAQFTVDAYPGQAYRGEVGKVRLNASMTQNVVTYTVEIITENPEGKLLPYMTANVKFEVARRQDVLTVQNSALRWTPAPDQIAPDARDQAPAGGRPRRSTSQPAAQKGELAGGGPTKSMLWVKDGPFVRPLRVRSGLSDGINTEIEGKNVDEGTEVIVEETLKATADDQTKSPFTPQMFRRR